MAKKVSEESPMILGDYTREEVVTCLEEMIRVMGLSDEETHDPLEVPEDITDEQLIINLGEAVEIIRPDEDEFSEFAQEVITAYNKVFHPERIEGPEDLEKILDEIQNASNLKELKKIATSYKVFKEMTKVTNIDKFRFKEDLRDELLRALVPLEMAPEAPEAPIENPPEEDDLPPVVEKKPVKKILAKKTPKPEPEPEPEPIPEPVVKKGKKPVEKKEPPEEKPVEKKTVQKKPAEKKPSTERYTRTRAVCETLKANPKADADTIAEKADALFVKNGGQSNLRHSHVQYNIIMQVLKIFEVI